MSSFLHSRSVQIAGQAVVITALLGGTAAFVGLNKPVTVTVDGEASQVRTFAGEVGDVLESQGVEVGSGDQVQPAVDAPVERGAEIVVNTSKDVELVVDGARSSESTYGNTVDQVLADLGVDARGAEVSLPGDEPVDSGSTVIQVSTPKVVQVVADGESVPVEDSTATVGDALSAAGVELGDLDIVSAPEGAHVVDGQTVRVLRVVEERREVEEDVDFEVEKKESDELFKGETKVETKGEKGQRTVVYDVRTVDGEETRKTEVSVDVTAEPVKQVVLEGTKEEVDMSKQDIIDMLGGPGSRWYKIAKCESEFNPKAVNQQNNAHFGLFQFKLATWRSVGGSGNPVDASPQEQFDRAKALQARSGWGQWACA